MLASETYLQPVGGDGEGINREEVALELSHGGGRGGDLARGHRRVVSVGSVSRRSARLDVVGVQLRVQLRRALRLTPVLPPQQVSVAGREDGEVGLVEGHLCGFGRVETNVVVQSKSATS